MGVYEQGILIEEILSEEKSSEALPKIFDELLKKYELEKIIYTNSPGSFMGIKVSYLMLKTLSIVKNIPLFAVNAFELNAYKPIPANKTLCFVYNDGEISLKKAEAGEFKLPKNIKNLKISNISEPNYIVDFI